MPSMYEVVSEMKRNQYSIKTAVGLDNFRRFLLSIYKDVPRRYIKNREMFLERDSNKSWIYVRAADKCTVLKTSKYTIISAKDVLDIFYRSKSGNTKLHWSLIPRYRNIGKVTGRASSSVLINLVSSGIYNDKNIRDALNDMDELD